MIGIGDLVIQIGAIGNSKEVKEFGNAVRKAGQAIDNYDKKQNSTIKTLRNVGIAIGATIIAMERLTNSLIQNNQAWLNLSNQTDLALNKLQGYAGVASLFDKTLGMQGAAGSIQALNDKLFELRLTGRGAEGFQIGGINPYGQDAFGVLEQVRNRIQGLNNTQASYLLKQLGLDPRLLPMLRMEREEFEKLRQVEQRLTLTDDERAEILKYQIQLSIAQQKIQLMWQRITLALLPLWTKLVGIVGDFAEGISNLVRWFRNLKPLTQGLIAVFGVLGAVMQGKILTKFLKTNKLAKLIGASFKMVTKRIPLLGMAFKGLASTVAKALLPLVSLYLLLEDFAVWQMGGKSVIGDFLDWKNNRNKYNQELETPTLKTQAEMGPAKGSATNQAWAQEVLQQAKLWEMQHGYTNLKPGQPSPFFSSPEYFEMMRNRGNTTNNTTNSPTVNQYNYISTSESGKEAERGMRTAMGSVAPIHG